MSAGTNNNRVTAAHFTSVTAVAQLSKVGEVRQTENGGYFVGLTFWTGSGNREKQDWTTFDCIRFLNSEESAVAFQQRAMANLGNTVMFTASNMRVKVTIKAGDIAENGKRKPIIYSSIKATLGQVRFFGISDNAEPVESDVDLDDIDFGLDD